MVIKIYLDGASLADMKRLAPEVDGFTTNPTLLRQAGITNYRQFAREVLAIAGGKPVSFEVLADEPVEMERQAHIIWQWAGWNDNVLVKIPIINSRGESNTPLIGALARGGISVNVTAVFTWQQVVEASEALGGSRGIISVFAGRIGDAGADPGAVIRAAHRCRKLGMVLWASTREIDNVRQAEESGADIITMAPALFEKMTALKGKDLDAYARETVQQFVNDAKGIEF